MTLFTFILSLVLTLPGHDIIPDFSRVGYKWGDAPIPELEIKAVILQEDLKKGLRRYGDTTAFIQSVLDRVGRSGGGAVVLGEGVWNISRPLWIDQDNVVLRGQSREGTVIKGNSILQMPLICMGKAVACNPDKPLAGNQAAIDGRVMGISRLRANDAHGSYSIYLMRYNMAAAPGSASGRSPVDAPVVYSGSPGVPVKDPGAFETGDRICICWNPSDEWFSDIKMDRIASNGREAPNGTKQWNEPKRRKSFNMKWERIVTGIEGNILLLDAPLVMRLDAAYGQAFVEKTSSPRISGSGVENISLDSSYDPDIKDGKGRCVDESHSWVGVDVANAEHCWVRNVTSRHLGYALVDLRRGAKCISVLDCTCLEPVSVVSGARRYAFCISKGELCLFKNCTCDSDRHSFVTNGCVQGPNVFTNCKSTNSLSDIGPHQSWATGCLFDRIDTDGDINVQDRGSYGTGHGWAGANFVLWNCEIGGKVSCQSPWVSALNYAVGCSGLKYEGRKYGRMFKGILYEDAASKETGQFPDGMWRPDGQWYPARKIGETAQGMVSLPCKDAELPEWWPVLSLDAYDNPLSLYECQLQDRHAAGVKLDAFAK